MTSLADPISQRLEKRLGLTPAGKIRIQFYPLAALQHAERELNSAKSIREPYRYFSRIASQFCKDHHLDYDFFALRRSLEEAGYSLNTPESELSLIEKSSLPPAAASFQVDEFIQQPPTNPDGSCYFGDPQCSSYREYLFWNSHRLSCDQFRKMTKEERKERRESIHQSAYKADLPERNALVMVAHGMNANEYDYNKQIEAEQAQLYYQDRNKQFLQSKEKHDRQPY